MCRDLSTEPNAVNVSSINISRVSLCFMFYVYVCSRRQYFECESILGDFFLYVECLIKSCVLSVNPTTDWVASNVDIN